MGIIKTKLSNLSFKNKIFLSLLQTIVMLVLIFMVISIFYTEKIVQDFYNRQLDSNIQLMESEVSNWISQGLYCTTLLSNLNVTKTYLRWHELKQTTKNDLLLEDIRHELISIKKAFPYIDSISLLHPESGKAIVAEPLIFKDRIRKQEPYFKKAKNEVFISPVAYSIGREKPILTIAAPLILKGKLLFIAAIEMNLKDLQIRFDKKNNIKDSVTTYLVDRYGFFVAKPKSSMEFLERRNIGNLFLERLLDEELIQIEFEDEDRDNQNYLLKFKWIETLNLCLISEINHKIISIFIHKIWFVIVFLSLIVSAIGIYYSKKISSNLISPILDITNAVRDLEKGSPEINIQIKSENEIGTLSAAFNQMSDRIKKSYDKLEEQVELRTIELSRTNKKLLSEMNQRRKTELELKKSEERYNIAMDAAQDGLYDWDLVSNAIYYSPGWKKMLGYEDMELPNDFSIWEKLTDPDDVKRSWEMQQELINKERDRFELEFKMKHKDGHWVDILSRAKAIFDTNGKAIRIVGTHVDITELKQTENELKLQSEAIENSLNGFNIVDEEGKLIYANKSFVKMYGYESVHEIIGMSPVDFCLDPTLPQRVIKTLKKEGRYEFEHVAKRKNGSTIDVLMYARLAFDKNGREIYPTTSIDITERNKALLEKEKLEKRLNQSQRLESIGTLAGGIAHDFNNILYPIIGFTEISIEDLPKDHPVQENLIDILQGAKRARDLVKQILSFSRQRDIEQKTFPLQPLIKETLNLLRATLPSNIEIKQNLFIDDISIFANATEIHEVIMNLCTNSYHAMEKNGGQLTVGLHLSQPITDDMMPSVDYCCLSISDTGSGIPKEIIDNVFDPYFTTKEQGKGSGLGLAVIHGIVENYNGKIEIQSESKKGTIVNVFLPVTSKAKAIVNPDEINDCTIQECDEHILFVDDETAIVKLGGRILERLGYTVTGKNSSSEALELFTSNPDKFDLVITDMTMPGLIGTQLSKKIRKIRPDIPILICTGFSEQLDKETAGSYGIKGYISKPILQKDLTSKVRELLDQNKEK